MGKKSLPSGYNFVERHLLGKEIEDVAEVTSIVAFLRRLRRGEALPRQIKVEGLDRLLLRMHDRDSIRFLRRLFADASDALTQQGPVVVFVVTKVVQNQHPQFVVDGKEVAFYQLFSKSLRHEDVGHWWSGFAVS